MIARGDMVERFEEQTALHANVQGAVATASGSSAIEIALRALSVGPDTEVILPTYVCGSVLKAVQSVGGTPVLCDVSPGWVMDRAAVEQHVGPRTAAIIVVHTFGIASDIDGIMSLGCPVIEDACQSFGMCLGNRFSGSIGTIGVYSFHATKCLTTGEGGMVISDSAELISAARSLRNGDSAICASPMSDLQASLGIAQLSRYHEFIARRNEIRRHYDKVVGANRAPKSDFLFRYPIISDRPFAQVQDWFSKQSIHVRRGVDALLHSEMELDDERFPNACHLWRSTISVPFFPGLSCAEVDRVVEVLADANFE